MSDSIPSNLAATESVAGSETVFALPIGGPSPAPMPPPSIAPASVPAALVPAALVPAALVPAALVPSETAPPTAPPTAPFTGFVHKVTPSTIDPSSPIRVWKDIVDEIGDQKLVVLDIADIAEMDRRAITAMVQCFKRLERKRVRFCLSSPQRQVEAMLELLGVLHLVEAFGTVEEAKASLTS